MTVRRGANTGPQVSLPELPGDYEAGTFSLTRPSVHQCGTIGAVTCASKGCSSATFCSGKNFTPLPKQHLRPAVTPRRYTRLSHESLLMSSPCTQTLQAWIAEAEGLLPAVAVSLSTAPQTSVSLRIQKPLLFSRMVPDAAHAGAGSVPLVAYPAAPCYTVYDSCNMLTLTFSGPQPLEPARTVHPGENYATAWCSHREGVATVIAVHLPTSMFRSVPYSLPWSTPTLWSPLPASVAPPVSSP